MIIQTINPSTEEILKEYPVFTEKQITSMIEAAHLNFTIWKNTAFSIRIGAMEKLAHLLLQQKEDLALLITTEMGKPIRLARAEIEKCVLCCKHYINNAETYLADYTVKTNWKQANVCHQPLGVLFAIMPWNYPFWQVFRCAIPALFAGNAVIVKHAPITTGVGMRLAALFLEAGFPDHLFQNIILSNEHVECVIAHPKIAAVTFTGSKKVGAIVAKTAGAHLKKIVLELGGNDPYLVLEDANISHAATVITESRLNNSGQACIAPKRIIALKAVFKPLCDAILEKMMRYTMGDPRKDETNFGPMARADLRKTLHEQVLNSVQLGAKLLEGGMLPAGKGFYYPPTMLTNVHPGMPAFDEELFGPVLSMIEVNDEKEGIHLANQSEYGLGGGIFTQNLQHGEELAREAIEAGACFVNAAVVSDPKLPFGGIKQSGFGRELAREGILEFVNIKTIAIN